MDIMSRKAIIDDMREQVEELGLDANAYQIYIEHLNIPLETWGDWDSDFSMAYLGQFSSPQGMAREWCRKYFIFEELPFWARKHFNFDSYANELMNGYSSNKVWEVDGYYFETYP